MEKHLKPVKAAFIFSKISLKVLFIFFLAIVFYVSLRYMLPDVSPGIELTIMSLLAVTAIYWWYAIVYKKLIFIFYDNKIVQKGGTLFSDYETELNIKNITHLKLRLSFVENKLFDTGHIDIESAGALISEIRLSSMAGYQEIRSSVVELMKKNGFRLDKGELLMTEKPNSLGVFFETFKSFVLGLLFTFYIIFSVMHDDDGNRIDSVYNFVMGHLLPIIGLVIGIVFIAHVFKFLDLKKRVYEIYQNVIAYHEGFLSKNYSLLPFENMTDSGVTQTIVDRLFGLYDVKISCQGSSHEVLFKNISSGREMSDKLDELIRAKDNLAGSRQAGSSASGAPGDIAQKSGASASGAAADTPDKVELDYDRGYKREFRMDFGRAVKFPLLVLAGLAVLYGIFLMAAFMIPGSWPGFMHSFAFIIFTTLGALFASRVIFGYIAYRCNRYLVKERSVRHKYKFLRTIDREFSSDRVTGVVISRNFIDKWFNTMTVGFWSIGAGARMNFAHIKKEDKVIENIVSKFGIRREEVLLDFGPEFILTEYIKSILPLFVALGIIALVFTLSFLVLAPFITVLILVFFSALFAAYYFYIKECYKRTRITFCRNFVYYEKGWLFRWFYYAKYDDIKDIATTRYPLSDEGRIKFNVAGECFSNRQKGKSLFTSNSFTIDFVPGIREKDELVDYILHVRPDKSGLAGLADDPNYHALSKPERTIKPCLRNSLIPFWIIMGPVNALFLFAALITGLDSVVLIIFAGVLAFTLLVMLPIYLPVKMTTYFLDGYRVLSKSGVFYKKQVSIVYSKIDFINNNQGAVNKIFRNGNVTVNTIGSSKTELTIGNIPDYQDFYAALKKRYENNE